MPARAEHHLRTVFSLLDQRVDIAVAGYALRIGVLGKRTKAQAERLVVGVRQFALAAKVNHLVAEQRVANFRELLAAHRGNPNADNLRAHGGRKRPGFDMAICGRAIIELACRMQVHVSKPYTYRSLNTHKVVPAAGSIISGVRLRLPASKAPPPPAMTTTYCTPSTAKAAGEELGLALSTLCHNSAPVAAS